MFIHYIIYYYLYNIHSLDTLVQDLCVQYKVQFHNRMALKPLDLSGDYKCAFTDHKIPETVYRTTCKMLDQFYPRIPELNCSSTLLWIYQCVIKYNV
jgi:hypothetical protein